MLVGKFAGRITDGHFKIPWLSYVASCELLSFPISCSNAIVQKS